MKRVFIGGMGRSGTTITLNALYRHGALYAVPIETKFLVENDGFYDLIQAITDDFSTAGTPVAVKRFEHLMRNLVTGLEPSESFTAQARFSSDIFEHYEGAVDCLLEMVLCRNFYPQRAPVLNAMRHFIAYTFDHATTISDKSGWVEKTPANFWRLEFLRELYPDSYFVHLIRDPRMIMWSLMEKGWISTEVAKAAIRFENMIAALVLKRRKLLKSPRFIEVRLEDLASPETLGDTLNQLANQLDLEPFPSPAIASVAETIATYERSRDARGHSISYSKEEALIINQLLMPWILELGYSPVFPASLLTE